MSTARVMTTGLEFPEGPIAMVDGSVIVVEIKPGISRGVIPMDQKMWLPMLVVGQTAQQLARTARCMCATTVASCGEK